jgi:hypothetical protein
MGKARGKNGGGTRCLLLHHLEDIREWGLHPLSPSAILTLCMARPHPAPRRPSL